MSTPQSPPTAPLARRLLEAFKAPPSHIRVPCRMADARSGTAPFVDAAAAIFGGVPGIAHIRSPQHIRVGKRDQHVADYWATPPGPPQRLRIRGGQEVGATVGRARLYVCSHHPKRFSVAITSHAEARSRDLRASDLPGRTREMVQGHPRRGLGEVFLPDWKSSAGWSPLPKQPGEEGARQRVSLSRLVDPRLCVHPDQQAPLKHHLPADTVGRLRANGQVECLVQVSDHLVSSAHPQEKLQHFTQALHEVLAFGHSKKPMLQRPWGRLDPPPFLKYRADAVMRNMPVLST